MFPKIVLIFYGYCTVLSQFQISFAILPVYTNDFKRIDLALRNLQIGVDAVKAKQDKVNLWNRKQFHIVREHLKQIRKNGLNNIGSGGTRREFPLPELYWNELVHFCRYESKNQLLVKEFHRNRENYQYVSNHEDLNDCVYLNDQCGGILVGHRGIISFRGDDTQLYTQWSPFENIVNDLTRCIWTVRTNDPDTTFGLRPRNENENGFKLSITSMQELLTTSDIRANYTSIDFEYYEDTWSLSTGVKPEVELKSKWNYTDDVYFVTLVYNRFISVPDFVFRFEGKGTKKNEKRFLHYHHPSGSRDLCDANSIIGFPGEPGRIQEEYATFVLNPDYTTLNLNSLKLNFTNVNTGSGPQYEVSFFRNTMLSYEMAGMNKNETSGQSRTFRYEKLPESISTGSFIGIVKFLNPNSTDVLKSGLKFSWSCYEN